jgi:hypothetical protein
MKRLKIQTHMIMVLFLGNFIKSKLTLVPKHQSIPLTCSTITKNLQKNSEFGSHFRRSKRHHLSILRNFFRLSLTRPFENSITSPLLRVGLCMPLRSKSNVCRSSWGTHCPRFCTSVFALVNTNCLSIEPHQI